MARACDVCGKSTLVGHTISHAHNVSKRRWRPNLRSVRARIDGRTVRLMVCTRCLRSGRIVKATR
ncbi:MAG: 50S ribosomal protein L28 [Thermoanaerobaculaceae bacterium]|jgi:large subunit ribosomal protein L28|nr:50S ribosomal protein L28 [Thermoanaerobaculaceae bacterium]